MARKVKISILSGSRTLESASSAIKSFGIMKDYWISQFEQVAYDRPDFVVLPEACDRFLDMDGSVVAEYDDIRENEIQVFFSKLALDYRTGIVYNTRIANRNTSYACMPDGALAGRYDKVFPTTWEMDDGIIPGREAVVFDFGPIKKAGFAICFDLNFDELREEYAKRKPEVIFFSSMYHGGLMQRTWAYTTRSFFVSSICARECAITAPNGRIIANSTNYTEFCTGEINLDSELIHLDFNRDKFGDIKKKYGPGVIIDDIGYLGSALLSCELEDKTMDDVIREFDLIKLDDYFNHSRAERTRRLP
ncbi:MAG: carbon-nitrogen hydrolase family protein [Clostridia bacterium]